jgi:hypothetical protein
VASIREQIILAAQAALSAAGGPAGLNVYRERQRPIEVSSLPACVIYAEDDAPRPFDGNQYKSPLVERLLAMRVEGRAQGDQATPADAALDPILVWITKQMFKDEKFGGLANGVVEGRTAWLSAEGDVSVAAAAISFTIKYRTSRLDPTSQS